MGAALLCGCAAVQMDLQRLNWLWRTTFPELANEPSANTHSPAKKGALVLSAREVLQQHAVVGLSVHVVV